MAQILNKQPKLEHFILIWVMGIIISGSLFTKTQAMGNYNTPLNRTISSGDLLAIYILAFDNQSTSTANLTGQYQPTIEEIVQATKDAPTKTAVILADLDDMDDTHILVLQNGNITPISGLPNADGVLQNDLFEYDMSDGAALGGFIKWSRSTYEADKTILSYVGHGGPLIPETDLNNLFFSDQDGLNMNDIIPLPNQRGLHVDFTDQHPLSLISPYDLAYALKIGTDDGANPIAVLDLIHCFSATIEQFYEVHPYVERITGSPNYTYSDPVMLGDALNHLEGSMTASEMADTIINRYDQVLPETEHPRLLVAIDATKLPAVKEAWDDLSFQLLQGFNTDSQRTRQNLFNAYLNSAKYDTTFCDTENWDLAPPDALSDMADFSIKMAQSFGLNSEIGLAAYDAAQDISGLIVARYARAGEPWFAPTGEKPTWEFPGAGLAIYTDFVDMATDNGVVYLNQPALWYTPVVQTGNLHPYKFIQYGDREVSWASVFERFWLGQTIDLAPCLFGFPPAQKEGELSVVDITYPTIDYPNGVSVDAPVHPAVTFEIDTDLENPLIQFTVQQGGDVVFSNTVGAGYLVAGTHQIEANTPWLPELSGEFELRVVVDADNRVLEADETDNIKTFQDVVLPKYDRPMLNGSFNRAEQLFTDSTIAVDLTQSNTNVGGDITQLKVDVYQYDPQQPLYAQVPYKVYEETFSDVTLSTWDQFTFPNNLRPGPVFIKVWGVTEDGAISVEPLESQLNYMPAQTSIVANEMHYFMVDVHSGDTLNLSLSLLGNSDANLFVWLPQKYNFPTWQSIAPGDDVLQINPIPYTGQYVIGVQGASPTAYYTLEVMHREIATTHQIFLPLILVETN